MRTGTVIALAVLLARAANAGTYGDVSAKASASVRWGSPKANRGGGMSGLPWAWYRGGYSTPGYFEGTATALAIPGWLRTEVHVAGASTTFSQQYARATASFKDTFVVSGPHGRGWVSYSLRSIDTWIYSGDCYFSDSETRLHNGKQLETYNRIRFGRPFTFQWSIATEAGFHGVVSYPAFANHVVKRDLLDVVVYDEDGTQLTHGYTIVSAFHLPEQGQDQSHVALRPGEAVRR